MACYSVTTERGLRAVVQLVETSFLGANPIVRPLTRTELLDASTAGVATAAEHDAFRAGIAGGKIARMLEASTNLASIDGYLPADLVARIGASNAAFTAAIRSGRLGEHQLKALLADANAAIAHLDTRAEAAALHAAAPAHGHAPEATIAAAILERHLATPIHAGAHR